MARRDFKLRARIEAEDRASGPVGKVESRFKRFGNFLRSNFAASLISVTALFAGLTAALRSSVKASAEQELAVRKLDAALAPLGERASAVSKNLQEQAAALQQVTAYGDETIIQGQAVIASFTQNEEAIKAATAAALDLSAATGQNLLSAFLLLGRAAAGETSMLSRYGITLDENTPKSEKFAAAIAKINAQFGGQAQEQAKTFTGQLAQLANEFGDLNEVIGDAITQNQQATDSLNKMKESVKGLQDEARALGTAFAFYSSALVEAKDPMAAFILALANMAKTLTETGKNAHDALSELISMPGAFRESGDAASDATEEMRKLREELKAQADAYAKAVDSATAFGEVTSVQLESKILNITQALHNQKLILGENSREYIHLEEIASARITSLRERIDHLRKGLGDVKEDTQATTEAIMDYARVMDESAASTERATRAAQRHTQVLGDEGRAATQTSRALFPGLSGASYSYTVAGTPFGGGAYVQAGTRRARVTADGRIVFI